MKIKLTALSLVLMLGACGESGVSVKRADYGNDWPFNVEEGVEDCVRGMNAIFRHAGAVYGLNGKAVQSGYIRINDIWRDDPDVPDTKINIGPMIQLALKQCH
jgi:hypothetical protein